MKVIALEKGHDGKQVREAGETFDIELDPRATWYVEVKAKAANKQTKAESAEGKGDDIA